MCILTDGLSDTIDHRTLYGAPFCPPRIAPNQNQKEKQMNEQKPLASSYQVGGEHYKNKGVQPWTAMESWMSPEQFEGFLRGNVIKYIARYKDKDGLKDVYKARHYLERLLECLEERSGKRTE
jgi:hypothetical protein